MAAGLALFGSRGFDGASTREIAAAAGLSAPSLQYYFNNKGGLYRACARDVAARIWSGVEAPVVASERLLRNDASDRLLISAFCDIQAGLLDGLNGADDNWVLLIAREQSGLAPAAGFRLVGGGMRRMLRVQTAIIRRLSGLANRAPESLIREMSLNAQVFFFGMMRRGALAGRRAHRIEARTLSVLEQVIREHSSAVLRTLIAARRRRAQRRP
jgi:AcrR family transcriptional regulator